MIVALTPHEELVQGRQCGERRNEGIRALGRSGWITFGTLAREVRGRREGTKALLVRLVEFSDADSTLFSPHAGNAFGPLENIYEMKCTRLLRGEWRCQTEDANCRLYLGR